MQNKDFWDKLKILSGILIPVAIAYAGHIYAHMQHKTEIINQNSRFEHELQVSKTNSKVGQIGLVSNFFEALLSDSPKRKKLAIQSVLIAMPNEGPQLVKIVSESEEQNDVKDFATTSLNNKRSQLVQELFSDDRQIRLAAYHEINSGWKNDDEMAIEITNFGMNNLNNENGVYNALLTLSHLNKTSLTGYAKNIEKFSRQAEVNGSKTAERAIKLRSRIHVK